MTPTTSDQRGTVTTAPTTAITTVADLIAALSTFDPATPVGIVSGRAAVAPLAVAGDEVRGPHPGWEAESGLPAVGFALGTKAALFHERKGGVLRTVVKITDGVAPAAAASDA